MPLSGGLYRPVSKWLEPIFANINGSLLFLSAIYNMHNLQIKNNGPCMWIKSMLENLTRAEIPTEQTMSNKEELNSKENMNNYCWKPSHGKFVCCFQFISLFSHKFWISMYILTSFLPPKSLLTHQNKNTLMSPIQLWTVGLANHFLKRNQYRNTKGKQVNGSMKSYIKL